MMEQFYKAWQHAFKLDPDKEISDEHLDMLCMSGTDAIIIGGSSGVTFENTVDLLSRVRRYSLDCALEVSTMESAVPGFDGYFVPFVVNTENVDWLMGQQLNGLKEYGPFIPWEMTVASAYLILNEQCTAAKLTEAKADLRGQDVIPYVWLADRLWRMPILYVENSGQFGDMNTLRLIADELQQAHLIYGGGITDAKLAGQAAQYAHTTVVGNIVYENIDAALATVEAVKQVRHNNS